jgi:hypothetical protein
MRVLLWILFATFALLAVAVLGLAGWASAGPLRALIGPGLESPTFRLEPGSTGAWDPVWPTDFDWPADLELRIETDPPWTDPESFEVVLVASPDRVCGPCGDSIGSPSQWSDRGRGVLPIGSPRSRESGPRWNSPLCMRPDGPARIEWTVASVRSDFADARARLVLRYPEQGVPVAFARLRSIAGRVFEPFLLFAICAAAAALALRHGRKRAALI